MMAISLSGPMAEVTVSAAHEGLYGRAYLSVRPVKVIGVAQADHFRPCGGSAGPGACHEVFDQRIATRIRTEDGPEGHFAFLKKYSILESRWDTRQGRTCGQM
jgi:hypothetical protein